MANKEAYKNGVATRFKKGHNGTGGRPRRVLPKPEDLYDAEGNKLNAEGLVNETNAFLLTATNAEMIAAAKDDTLPVYVRRRLEKALGSKKDFTEEIREAELRVLGKPTQHTDVTSNGETLTQFLVTDKEKDILDKLSK